MPAALYAISFKKTGNLLAICSFEKQAPADQAAWDQLLTTLIGDKLTMAIGPAGPMIALAPQDLALDAIGGPAQPENVIANVYSYRIDLSDPNTRPGDGKDKALAPANANAVTAMKIDAVARQVIVTLNTAEGAVAHKVYLLFEGCDPVEHETTIGSADVKIPIDPSVALVAGTRYRFAFVKHDVSVTPGYLAP